LGNLTRAGGTLTEILKKIKVLCTVLERKKENWSRVEGEDGKKEIGISLERLFTPRCFWKN